MKRQTGQPLEIEEKSVITLPEELINVIFTQSYCYRTIIHFYATCTKAYQNTSDISHMRILLCNIYFSSKFQFEQDRHATYALNCSITAIASLILEFYIFFRNQINRIDVFKCGMYNVRSFNDSFESRHEFVIEIPQKMTSSKHCVVMMEVSRRLVMRLGWEIVFKRSDKRTGEEKWGDAPFLINDWTRPFGLRCIKYGDLYKYR